MKKILAVILAFSLMMSGACVYAGTGDKRFYDSFKDGIDKWETYSDENSEVNDEDSSGNSAMSLVSSSPINTSGNIKSASPEFSSNGEAAVDFTFKTDYESASTFNPDRTVYLAWGDEAVGKSMSKLAPIFCIEGQDLLVGNNYDDAGVTIEKNTEYNFKILINTDDHTAKISINGNEPITTELWNATDFDPSALRIVFETAYSKNKKNAVSTKWDIYSFAMSNTSGLELETDIFDTRLTDTDIGEINVFSGNVITSADCSLKKQNGEEYEDVAARITLKNSSFKIVPDGELEPNESYRIIVENAVDLFGNSGASASTEFKTVPANYQKPEISINSVDSGDKFRVGNSIPIGAEITHSVDIERVEYYVNDSLYKTIFDEPYECKYKISEVGDYTIYAKIYDILGGEGKSDSVTVSATPNEAPTVSFVGLADGMVEVSRIQNISVTAEDDSGIASVELFVDGKSIEKKTEAPYTFSYEPTLGKHTITATAIDTDNSSENDEIKVTIVKSSSKNIFTEDFSAYPNGNTEVSGSNLYLGLNGGYLKGGQIDAEHGQSLMLGFDADQTAATNQLFGILDYSNTGILNIKNDLYFSTNDVYVVYKIRATDAGGNMSSPDNVIFQKNGDSIEICFYNGSSIGKKVTINALEWNTVKYSINLITQKYDFYLNDMETPVVAGYNFRCNFAQVNFNIRYEYYCGDRQAGYMAVDNYSYDYDSQLPYVTSITGENGGAVEFGKNIFVVNTNTAMGNVSMDRITLTKDGENVPLDYISKRDKGFLAATKEPLSAGCRYALKIDSKVTDSEGNMVGYDSYAEFTASAGSLSITDGKFVKNSDTLSFSTKVNNITGDSKTITLAVVIYKDGRIVKTEYITKPIASTTTMGIDNIDIPEGNITAKAFVFGGWNDKTPITNNVYTLN